MCSYCPYKLPCWGRDKLQLLPQQQSKGKILNGFGTSVTNPKEKLELMVDSLRGLFTIDSLIYNMHLYFVVFKNKKDEYKLFIILYLMMKKSRSFW